jgi:DNA-binding response OmpR family regulator
MVITDMRMESDDAGAEVISAAQSASYHPAIALLTAFPIAEEDWQTLGADKMLVKPMHTQVLLQQIEKLLASHEARLTIWSVPLPASAAASKAAKPAPVKSSRPAAKQPAAIRAAAKKSLAGRSAKNIPAKKSAAKRAAKSSKP